MRKLVAVLSVMVLVLGVAVIYSYAAESKAVEKSEAREAKAAAAADTRWDAMMTHANNEMKRLGMPDGELMRHDEIVYARFTTTNPIGLMALRDTLRLSREQEEKIDAINDRARREAMGVLSGEQIQIVEAMKGAPESMHGICEDMTQRAGGHEIICPACARPFAVEERKESPAVKAREMLEGPK